MQTGWTVAYKNNPKAGDRLKHSGRYGETCGHLHHDQTAAVRCAQQEPTYCTHRICQAEKTGHNQVTLIHVQPTLPPVEESEATRELREILATLTGEQTP